MRTLTPFALLLAFAVATLLGRPKLPAQSVPARPLLPQASYWLTQPPSELKGKPLETEALLDLVGASLRDSTMQKRRQHHEILFGGGLQIFFGLCWEFLDPRKQKYVGTSSRPMEVFEGVALERDINLFIMPHLPRYVGMIRNVYQSTLARNHGNDRQFRMDNPPFSSPEELRHKSGSFFTVECEVTPPAPAWDAYAQHVMPLKPGTNLLSEHPNFGTAYPSFGMMGPLCLDCNHNCRPEIHPTEWLWWLDLSPDSTHPDDWHWIAALIHDGTTRFEDWSPSPLEGQIAIPYRIPASAAQYEFQIQTLVDAGAVQPAAVLPAQAQPLSQGGTITLPGTKRQVQVITKAGSNNAWWWFGTPVHDPATGDLFGHLHIAAAAEHLAAFRVSAGVR